MLYPSTHKCNPQWEVCFGDTLARAIDYGITQVYAFDEEYAVETAAEKDDCDSGEYSIVTSGESKAWVRALGSEDWLEYLVTAESVPQYTAHAA